MGKGPFQERGYREENGGAALKPTFDEIERIAGIPLDHSSLQYKKELMKYGCQAEKMAMKKQAVALRGLRFSAGL